MTNYSKNKQKIISKFDQIELYFKQHNKKPDKKMRFSFGTSMFNFILSLNKNYNTDIQKCKYFMKNPLFKQRFETLKKKFPLFFENNRETALRKIHELDLYFQNNNGKKPDKKTKFICGTLMINFLHDSKNKNYNIDIQKCKQCMKDPLVKKKYEYFMHKYPLYFETEIQSTLRKINEIQLYIKQYKKKPAYDKNIKFSCGGFMYGFITRSNKLYHIDPHKSNGYMKYPIVKKKYEDLIHTYPFLFEKNKKTPLLKLKEIRQYFKQFLKKPDKKIQFSFGTSMLTFLRNCYKNYHSDIQKCKQFMKNPLVKKLYEQLILDYPLFLKIIEIPFYEKLMN